VDECKPLPVTTNPAMVGAATALSDWSIVNFGRAPSNFQGRARRSLSC